MITIVDYGVGNLFSLNSSFAYVGAETCLTGDPEAILKADKIVLPGVGAFGDAADRLQSLGLGEALCAAAKKGTPLLGICLGMQLLLERSFEYGEHAGLGLIPGHVDPIADVIPPDLKIPHIGWNALKFTGSPCPLFRKVREGEHVYFVHSYHGVGCGPCTAAVTEYGAELTAAVQRDNVFGCQFHPEKSGRTGLEMLRAFSEL